MAVIAATLGVSLTWPATQARAQCFTTQPGGAGTPVDYTCAANTTTNGGPNSNPSTATVQRNQIFGTGIIGQVNGGITVDGNGISLFSNSATAGTVVTMTNNGTISNSTNSQAALVLEGLSGSNPGFGTFNYSGTGNVTNTGTTPGSIGVSILNTSGTGGIAATVSGTSTISSAADLGMQLGTNTGAISLTVLTGGQVTGATSGVQFSSSGTSTLTNSGTVQGTAAGSAGAESASLDVTNFGTITGIQNGIQTTGAVTLANASGGVISGTGAGSTGITAGQIPGGSVSGSNAGMISGNAAGITSSGAVNLTSNSGTIQGTGASSFGISSFGVIVTSNTGTISGATAINSSGAGNDVNVTNSNTIAGTTTGIASQNNITLTNNVGATVSGGTSALTAPGTVAVINSGNITSTASSAVVVSAGTANVTNNASGIIQGSGPGGIVIGGSAVTLNNSGTVRETGSGNSIGVFGSTANVTNSGLIAANFVGIESLGTTTITNNVGGIIQATQAGNSAAILALGATTVTNAGTVTGNLDGVNTNTTAATTITNSGTITGTTRSGIRVNTATITNQTGGTIAGATGIVFRAGNSASSVFDAGTISGTGGTAIQFSAGSVGNTLTLGPGFVIGGTVLGAGSDTFQLGGTGNGNFDLGTIGAALQYRGFTTFNEVGTATWTVIGTFGQSNPWTVQSGTLLVNGNLSAASSLTVNAGATLGGTGTVGQTQINAGGTFAPGTPGTPGTSTTVSGSLAFQSGALYLVQINSSSTTRANVTGTATLAGNALAAFGAGGGLVNQYTILHSSGLGGTTFSALGTTNLPPGFTASLSYTNTDVLLNLTSTFGLAISSGLNGNQQSVANALNNFFNGGGTLTPGFSAIFGLTGGNLANALTQLSGEAATGTQQGAFQLMNQFLGIMLDPFVDGRGGVVGGAVGFAPERETLPADVALAYSKLLEDPVTNSPGTKAPTFAQRWSVWGSAYGGYNRTSGDPVVVGSHDLTARAGGFAAGMDYRVAPGTTVGFALAGGGTGWGLAQGLGTGRSEALQAGVYGTTRLGPVYVGASLAFTNYWMSTDRFAFAGDHLAADFKAQNYGARIEGGWRFATTFGAVTPYGALQGQAFRTPGYSETDLNGGGFGLAYNARTATAIRSEVGTHFDHSVMLDHSAVLALRGKLAWAHDRVSDATLNPAFQALPGAGFIVNGATPANNLALASFGPELRLANGISLFGKLDSELARNSSTYAGTGTLRVSW